MIATLPMEPSVEFIKESPLGDKLDYVLKSRLVGCYSQRTQFLVSRILKKSKSMIKLKYARI